MSAVRRDETGFQFHVFLSQLQLGERDDSKRRRRKNKKSSLKYFLTEPALCVASGPTKIT